MKKEKINLYFFIPEPQTIKSFPVTSFDLEYQELSSINIFPVGCIHYSNDKKKYFTYRFYLKI
jgi:hypothetical protein